MRGVLAAVGLLTDGLYGCLTAGKRPHFGWQLQTAPGSDPAAAYQSAYQLRLNSGAGDVVWESGVVQSARQHYVPYGGPNLAPDTDYRWAARIHDAAGMPGEWSEHHGFSTGLDTADWAAEWIRRAPGGRAPLEVFDDALRVGATPFLPVPGRPAAAFALTALVRPDLGSAGILFRSAGPGTGLLLELGHAGVILRPATAWTMGAGDIPLSEPLASAVPAQTAGPEALSEPTPGNGGGWRSVVVVDDGAEVTVSVDGEQLIKADLPASASAACQLALHQRPRSQAAYRSLSISDGEGRVLMSSHFSGAALNDGHAALAGWTRHTPYRQADEWTLARAEVKLTGTVVRARLFAAASHHAVFRINGVPCLETSSFGYPGEGYYDAADVTPLMRSAGAAADGSAATATLTGLVHWYGPGQGRAACAPGLLAQLHVDYSDGRREVFGTGPSWRVAEGPYRQSGYRNDEGDPVEHLDATAGTPRWEAATSIGMHPVADFPAVHPRRTFLAKETVDAAQLLTAADGTVVADFGRVIPGRPMVDFGTGVHGRTVMIRAGYNLRADGRVDTGKSASQNTDMSFPYTQVNGPQRYEAGVHLGFQYLEMPEVEAAELVKVSAVVVHAGHPAEGSFHSSDPALDAVFALLRDSARLGVQEQFVDTPTREKGQFLGDAVNISYATMALFGERNYTAQALREFAASATRYWHTGEDRGHFNAVYPNGDGKRDIPDFSLMMPEWVEEYHRFSGDTALVQELVPCLRATADYVLRHIPDTGPTACLVTELGGGSGPYLHGIVDWPAPGRFGYDMDCAAKTTVNAQAASALGAVSRLCLLAGDSPAARHYGDHAAALTAAINSLLRVGGAFVDGLHADGRPSHHASQHATSFPLSLGLTAAGEAAADAQRLAAMGMRQGPMTVHRLVRALLAAGLVDDVLELLTNAGQPGWARILAAGGTFTWEAWELEPGTDYSQSHAWSASVIREILEHLLGIRVVAAGGASLVIAPPVCRLEHASGEVPLQGGMATASWRRRGSLMELDCSVPAGVAATVLLPTGSYRVEGPTPAGPNAVEGPDGRGCVGAVHQVAYRIHPGSWSFRPA